MFSRFFSRRPEERGSVQAPTPAKAPCPFGVVTADEAPPWTEADRAGLRSFLAGPAGQSLRNQINFYEQGGNRRAVLLMDEKAAARAAGFHDGCAWLIALSADVRPEQDEHNQLPAGVRELAERFTP